MNVLLIGSGGREHALAWKLAQSPRLAHLSIAPGNAGTAAHGENVSLDIHDHAAVRDFCHAKSIHLVIVGPEAPLAAGLADDLQRAGIRVFGPTKAAAQIEASKSFAKQFMARHGIPTARFQVFSDFASARQHLRAIDYPVVIKASGLAAGKGVLIPQDLDQAEEALRQIMVERQFGAAGDEVVIEEKLTGPEVTLLAFSDGMTVKPMIPSQDHKRLLDGDQGPNTGGMGAYAPVPACPPSLVEELTRSILQTTVDGLRAEGKPFVGVLYGGFILTADGPRVLEFNCRFGDPEAQVVLPLLESDLLEIALACTEGNLAATEVRWKEGAAACVVLASGGYPDSYQTGYPISGLEEDYPNTFVFHAGTKRAEEQIVTAGGRVLCVSGWGANINEALDAAYARVRSIHFEGMHYRKDIGWRVRQPESAYAAAGVSIDAGNRAVELMATAVKSTYGPEVLAGIGAFGGLFDASTLQRMEQPVLVASTDGIGTKVKLAAQVGRYRSLGHDIVNHCINDILVQGARPLFFLDYFAASKLIPEITAEIVCGMAEACRAAGCALIGGETAEMPGVYAPGEFDVAGTIVGVLERKEMLPRPTIRPGDVLLGLRSSGPHTNGYSLIRKVFEGIPLDAVFPELDVPLVEALLAPHRSYYELLYPILAEVKALAHITGGGFLENIPRVLPEGVSAVVRRESWPVPPLFRLIQARGNVSDAEMYRVFNMGIGMVAIVAAEHAEQIQQRIPEQTWLIGELIPGNRTVILE